MAAESEHQFLERLRKKIADGFCRLLAVALARESRRNARSGGIDLIVIYNSGRYRMAGQASLSGVLAYGNANEIVKEMAYEVITAVTHTPVLAGVNGTDPFMLRDHFFQGTERPWALRDSKFSNSGLLTGYFAPI